MWTRNGLKLQFPHISSNEQWRRGGRGSWAPPCFLHTCYPCPVSCDPCTHTSWRCSSYSNAPCSPRSVFVRPRARAVPAAAAKTDGHHLRRPAPRFGVVAPQLSSWWWHLLKTRQKRKLKRELEAFWGSDEQLLQVCDSETQFDCRCSAFVVVLLTVKTHDKKTKSSLFWSHLKM